MKPALAARRPQKLPRRIEVSPLHRIDDEAHLGQFIPLHYHGQMLANEFRMAPFREAIEKLVPVGSHVVELGGGTGVLSYFAAKRARKVTMLERLPNVAAAARRLLAANGASDKVTVVEADAHNFVPTEPVDVVICEMLHAALLREKQIDVLQRFKLRHMAKFGVRVPVIIPEATILAMQLIHQRYDFNGYYAPVPFFLEAGATGDNTIEMGEPKIYSVIDYLEELPEMFAVDGTLSTEKTGTVNAVRFITKNTVGLFPQERRSADWHMPYLSVPLPQPIPVQAGDSLRVRFQYNAGGSIESLQSSLQASCA